MMYDRPLLEKYFFVASLAVWRYYKYSYSYYSGPVLLLTELPSRLWV